MASVSIDDYEALQPGKTDEALSLVLGSPAI